MAKDTKKDLSLTEKQAKNFLYLLLKIRMVEEEIARVYTTDVIKCPIHLSTGSEAVSVGVCAALKKSDYVIGGHRGHGMYLAKGAPLNEFMAEMYGKATGCSGGKGGSMHLTSPEYNVVGSTPILGSTIPIGVGVALASKMKKKNDVTAIFFGDGATEEGVFYESLNMASLLKTPVVFVCENNRYSIFQTQEIRQPLDNIFEKGSIFGMPGKRVDGNDAIAVYKASIEAVEHARKNGPYLLECMTRRWRQHVGPYYDYEIGFGTKEEIEKVIAEQDAVATLLKFAKKKKYFDAKYVDQIKLKVQKEIESAMAFVQASSLPKPEALYSNLY